MSLFNRIRDAFRKPEPPAAPTLRNRPGGMAWIRRFDPDTGAGAMAGRVVKTLRVRENGLWEISPQQPWVAAVPLLYEGRILPAGTRYTTVALADELLEPIPEVSDDAKDESLAWLPPVPTRKPEEVA